MASTLTKILIHITFSTKDRAPFIPLQVEPDLYAYVGGICRHLNSPLLALEGTSNHVHMLVSLGKTVALSDLMLNVKRESSKWIKQQDPQLSTFAWQDGYFGFSLGQSGVEALRLYIANQKEHHKHIDYKDELRNLLRLYELEWDEAFIWD